MAETFLEILQAQPIPVEFWKPLSDGARSGRPWHEVLSPYHIRQFAEGMAQAITEDGEIDQHRPITIRGPDIPGDVDHVNPSLPPITQTEVLAILAQFLWAERGEIVAGASIHPLHWLILTGVFAEERERYVSLREFVALGKLTQAQGGTKYMPSELTWPLTITEAGAHDIETLVHVRRHVPTLWRLKKFFAPWLRSVPLLGDVAKKRLGG